MLPDAAHLQEEEAEFANRHHTSKHDPALPLFTADDAARVLRLVRPVGFNGSLSPSAGVTARFLNSGHIVGAGLMPGLPTTSRPRWLIGGDRVSCRSPLCPGCDGGGRRRFASDWLRPIAIPSLPSRSLARRSRRITTTHGSSVSGIYRPAGGAGIWNTTGLNWTGDAGATWSNGFLPGITVYQGGTYPRVSDPAVAYDVRHNTWLAVSLTLRDSPSVRRGLRSARVSTTGSWLHR